MAEVTQSRLCVTNQQIYHIESFPANLITLFASSTSVGFFPPLAPAITDATMAGLRLEKIVIVAPASKTSPEENNLPEVN